MIKRFLVLMILFCLSISFASATIYLNPEASGNEVQINAALLEAYNTGDDTVHLNAGTYIVNDQVQLCEGVTLTGPDAEIKLCDDASSDFNGGTNAPVIIARSGHNGPFIITDITIDGNSQGNTDVEFGKGYYTLFYFSGCSNVLFENMRMEYAKNDGIQFRNGNGIYVKNCEIHMMGHEGLYSMYTDNVEFTNNTVFTRTNSACRIAEGAHVLIANNEIYSGTISSSDGGGSSTGPGIQVNIDAGQYARDIEICNNYIHDLRGSGIWMTSESDEGQGIYIHNNIFEDVGMYSFDNYYSTGGITIWQMNGTIIENNVFDNTGIAGVRYAKRASDATVSGQFMTIVRNNIFVNINEIITISPTPILNTAYQNHRFYAYNNCFYNNYDSDFDEQMYYNADNLYENPSFSDSMYHLNTNSPCIGTGYLGTDMGAYDYGSSSVGDLGGDDVVSEEDGEVSDDGGSSGGSSGGGSSTTTTKTDDEVEVVGTATDSQTTAFDFGTLFDNKIPTELNINGYQVLGSPVTWIVFVFTYVGAAMVFMGRDETNAIVLGTLALIAPFVMIYMQVNPFVFNYLLKDSSVAVAMMTFMLYGILTGIILDVNEKPQPKRRGRRVSSRRYK